MDDNFTFLNLSCFKSLSLPLRY